MKSKKISDKDKDKDKGKGKGKGMGNEVCEVCDKKEPEIISRHNRHP